MGATIIGRISDYTVIEWRKKRKGVWYPEDRLRASLLPFATIVPLSVLGFGLANRFVDGTLGLVLSLVCLFFNGVGVSGTDPYQIFRGLINNFTFKSEMSFGPVAAYLVDVLHSRSAESLAANRFILFYFCWWKFKFTLLASAFRSVIVALAVAATLPMIDTYGILVTNALCAVLVWISFVYVVVLKNKNY